MWYQADLEILIGNVLDAFALIDPAKIIDKMKLQVLPHLADDIRRFGPAIRYSTEIFECYNAIFRLCSVLSNHQAPSHDIANKFASMDCLKHMLSGGYWEEDDQWISAGRKVRLILHQDPFIQHHLGWAPFKKPAVGMECSFWTHKLVSDYISLANVQSKPKSKFPATQWTETTASAKGQDIGRLGFATSIKWHSGIHCIAQSGDKCKLDSWVFVLVSEVSGRNSRFFKRQHVH
jgi:hypothetical protein